MRFVLFAALAVLVAGCTAPAQQGLAPAFTMEPSAPAPERFDLSFDGNILNADLEDLSHMRPVEDALWAVQKVGFMLALDEVPAGMEVAMDWHGDGSSMIMLHSHKAHGTNTYVEHVSAMDPQASKCIRVPVEDLASGDWQVMVHADGGGAATFTLRVATWGTQGAVMEDRHGHWPQDGQFQVDPHDVLPCEALAPPAQG